MGMKYWLALANLVCVGCVPAGAVHETEAQVVVAASETGHDWYQGSQAEQARVELEQQLQEAVLAQLHPDFFSLWERLQAAPAAKRGAIYDDIFAKLSRFQHAWRGMDLVSREQMKTLKLDLNRPVVAKPGSDDLLPQVKSLRPQVGGDEGVGRRGRAGEPQHQAADQVLPRGGRGGAAAAAGAVRARRRGLRRDR